MKYKRYQDRSFKSMDFKTVFDAVLKEANISQKFSHERLKQSWGEVMGEPIARRTTKLFVKDKKLFIQLSSAPLKNELILAKLKVLNRVQEFLGDKSIEDVVFI
ncbi:MAG: hypothetical protein ACI81T_000354 [Bacteroidia bacterium]|jgi:hypothetical protein